MPMIQLKYASASLENRDVELANCAAHLAAQWLGKDPSVTAVLVERVPQQAWFIAGQPLAELAASTFWLDIRITEGTNTKDEKAAFIAATFKAMAERLGPLHEESYVHVVEARADAYGYGGLTQERRYIAARP